MHRLYFAHGQESGPWGRKIRRLATVAEARGVEVTSPDYTELPDPEARVAHLEALAPRAPEGRLILMGSSIGGYVATVASASIRPDGLFLLAPAFDLPHLAHPMPEPHASDITVIHGWRDAIVPVDAAIGFARRYGTTLHVIDAEHTLNEALETLAGLFDQFLERVLAPPTTNAS
jgi:alpha/beta superfamily hydrolase